MNSETNRDDSWNKYWEHGFLTSCRNAFSGNYEGSIRAEWISFFGQLQPGARVLDLFSGTGALGLEALSRGAANAWLVESDPRAAAAIASALDLLQVEKARLLQVDAISLLNSAEVKQFDVVFIDPPFETGLWEQVVSLLVEKNWLAEDCLVYLEYPSDQQPNLPVSLHWHRQAQAGAVGYGLAVHGPAN